MLQTLINAVGEAEKCANVANQLVSKKVRTRCVYIFDISTKLLLRVWGILIVGPP